MSNVNRDDISHLANTATDLAHSLHVIRQVIRKDPGHADALLSVLETSINSLAFNIADLGDKAVQVNGTLKVRIAPRKGIRGLNVAPI